MAILSRCELSDVEVFHANTHRPYALAATLQWAGRPLRVVCVHFSNTDVSSFDRFLRSGARRLKEAIDLTRRAKDWPDDVFIAGDFNAVPCMIEHLIIMSRLTWVPIAQPTHPAAFPVLQVDHMYCRGGLRATRIAARPSQASDHWPLTATLHLTAEGPSPALAATSRPVDTNATAQEGGSEP